MVGQNHGPSFSNDDAFAMFSGAGHDRDPLHQVRIAIRCTRACSGFSDLACRSVVGSQAGDREASRAAEVVHLSLASVVGERFVKPVSCSGRLSLWRRQDGRGDPIGLQARDAIACL
jgi:hypothetical protein